MDSAPARAVALYETFLAGSYEKTDELDDSSGNFGMFVDGLFRGWVQARQAAGADPDETARRLLAWMDSDTYGFCYQLERDLVKALDKRGLAAFDGACASGSTGSQQPLPGPASVNRIQRIRGDVRPRSCARSSRSSATSRPTSRCAR